MGRSVRIRIREFWGRCFRGGWSFGKARRNALLAGARKRARPAALIRLLSPAPPLTCRPSADMRGYRGVKYFLFIFCYVFWVLSAILIAVGIYAKVAKEKDVVDTLTVDPALLFMAVGSLTFSIAFLGCFGALRNATCLLKTFASILATLLLLQLTAGVLGYVFTDAVMERTRRLMMKTVLRYREDRDLENAIDFVQRKVTWMWRNRRDLSPDFPRLWVRSCGAAAWTASRIGPGTFTSSAPTPIPVWKPAASPSLAACPPPTRSLRPSTAERLANGLWSASGLLPVRRVTPPFACPVLRRCRTPCAVSARSSTRGSSPSATSSQMGARKRSPAGSARTSRWRRGWPADCCSWRYA
ncbi:uncharacterized protein LOC144197033 isoform X4 [Stigmatopora nigra]